MLRDTVLQHKSEKELLRARQYVTRDSLEKARKFLESDLVKVITGPRRAGKSVFAFLLLKQKNFAYLNFDDDSLLRVNSHDDIIKAVFEVYGRPQFIFFDEIQNLKNWELLVAKLQRRGHNLVITGSNARLLGMELATVLTGRYIPIEIAPFSFREFLRAKQHQPDKEALLLPETCGKTLGYLEEYVRCGGFPEIVVKGLECRTYLETLFDAILFKDIVKRYRVRFTEKLHDLAVYLAGNFSSEFTLTRLKNILGFNSVNTVQNYLAYLEETYLAVSLNRFSFKMKEQLKSSRKTYLVDNGFVQAKSFQSSANIGKLMENLVFGELVRRGYRPNSSLYFYKTRNRKEVDFVLREGVRVAALLQVAYQASDRDTEKREISALLEASQELKCDNLIVMTWDKEAQIERKGKGIKFIPLWKWLLNREWRIHEGVYV